jgi:CubicO group peptidase (beta-lactamase class C family)
MKFTALLASVAVAASQDGPGQGPWQTGTPESQGLSTQALDEAAERIVKEYEKFGQSRDCFVVVKNGVIVSEKYYNNYTESSTRAGASLTKSLCASLFGIAVEQGWASVDDLVHKSIKNGRQCNLEATMQNVLTMTGTSADIKDPTFSYDALGTECLNGLSDYIKENNPEGLTTPQFKDKYWAEPLGLEHTSWSPIFPGGPNLGCGFSASTSCRDLARAAQLWVNEGQWPGAGQLLSQQYAVDGRRQTVVTPPIPGFAAGGMYGYTMWLNTDDPVDKEIAHMEGLDAQCGYWSKQHEAIVVSMGAGDSFEPGCPPVWNNVRGAVVSKGHAAVNASR